MSKVAVINKLASARLAINHVLRSRGILKEAAPWSVLSPLTLPFTDSNYPFYGELRNYLPTLPDKQTITNNLNGLRGIQPFNLNKPGANPNRDTKLFPNNTALTSKTMLKPDLEENSSNSKGFGGMVGAFNRVRQSAHNAELFDSLRYLMQAGASPSEQEHLAGLQYQDIIEGDNPNGNYSPFGIIRTFNTYIPGHHIHELGHGLAVNGRDSLTGTPKKLLDLRKQELEALYGRTPKFNYYGVDHDTLMEELEANRRARNAIYRAFSADPQLQKEVLSHFDKGANLGINSYKYWDMNPILRDYMFKPRFDKEVQQLNKGSWELGNRIINYARTQGFNPSSSAPYSGINPYIQNLKYILSSGTDR